MHYDQPWQFEPPPSNRQEFEEREALRELQEQGYMQAEMDRLGMQRGGLPAEAQRLQEEQDWMRRRQEEDAWRAAQSASRSPAEPEPKTNRPTPLKEKPPEPENVQALVDDVRHKLHQAAKRLDKRLIEMASKAKSSPYRAIEEMLDEVARSILGQDKLSQALREGVLRKKESLRHANYFTTRQAKEKNLGLGSDERHVARRVVEWLDSVICNARGYRSMGTPVKLALPVVRPKRQPSSYKRPPKTATKRPSTHSTFETIADIVMALILIGCVVGVVVKAIW